MTFIKGTIPWNKGKKTSIETLIKLSASRIGRIPWNKGMKMSESHCKKLSLAKIGKVGPMSNAWKNGSSRNKHSITTPQYRQWRDAVFSRDKYTCTKCGLVGCYLEAHHIKPWREDELGRYNIDNGTTLCRNCHIKIDWHRAKFNRITKQQYAVL